MITESVVYWMTRMSYIHGILVTSGVISLMAFIFVIIISYTSFDDLGPERIMKARRFLISSFLTAMALIVIGYMVPTSREYATIKLVPLIANDGNSPETQRNAINVLNAILGKKLIEPEKITQRNDK